MITEAEKCRFTEICREITDRVHKRDGIGTYKEKILHLILKKYFCDDESLHEIKQGRHIADAANDGEIFEIQTGGLYPLKKKIPSYIEDTEKIITLVCPVVVKKHLVWINAESGEASEPRKVSVAKPKRKLLRELLRISSVVDFSRVRIAAVMLEVDEYKLLGADGNKKGAIRMDRIPRELVDIFYIDGKSAAAEFFLPADIGMEFRARDFEKATGLKRKGVSAGLRALEQLGVIEREKQSERKVVYRISQQ